MKNDKTALKQFRNELTEAFLLHQKFDRTNVNAKII